MPRPPTMTPARWFDTLKPIDPPGFAAEHPDWCRRHYAPAIRLHGNPTGAGLQLTGAVIRLIRSRLPAGVTMSAAQFMEHRAELGPACCIAGDEQMYRIWSRWLPR